jgi:hypothetical protein
MPEGVAPRAALAMFGMGTGARLGIQPVVRNLLAGGHDDFQGFGA